MWQEGKSLETFIIESKLEGKHEGEYLKALETAKKFKSKGMSLDFIQDITGLSINEIEKI